MRILQIIDFANRGGAEREMCLISKELSLRGHEIFLIHPPGPETDQFKKLENPNLHVFQFPLKQQNYLKTIIDLRKFIKDNKISIIHSHLYFSDFAVFLARLGIPRVRHFITLHMYLLNAKPKIPLRIIQIYFCAFLTYLFSTKIFAVSLDLCKHTSRKFFIPLNKIVRIFNGLDFSLFSIDQDKINAIKRNYNITQQDTVIVNLGLLNSEKGQSYIVDAMSKLTLSNSNIKCFLLGSDGGLKTLIEDKIREYKLENNVFLPGFQTDICSWLEVASIYLHPTLNDAMPLSIIEAMYFKKPVITTDLSAFNGLIINRENGLLVRRKSALDISNAVSELIADKNLYNKLSKNGFAFVNSNCTIANTVDNILKYYETCKK